MRKLLIFLLAFAACFLAACQSNSLKITYKYFTPYSPNSEEKISVIGFTLEIINNSDTEEYVSPADFTLKINDEDIDGSCFWDGEIAIAGRASIDADTTCFLMLRYSVSINYKENIDIEFKYNKKVLINDTVYIAKTTNEV